MEKFIEDEPDLLTDFMTILELEKDRTAYITINLYLQMEFCDGIPMARTLESY